MIGSIAGQVGFTPSGKSFSPYVGTTSSTSSVSLLSITGSGYLMSLSLTAIISGTTEIGYFTIIVDGVTKVSGAGFHNFESIISMLKFSSSLSINYWTSSGTRPITATACILLN